MAKTVKDSDGRRRKVTQKLDYRTRAQAAAEAAAKKKKPTRASEIPGLKKAASKKTTKKTAAKKTTKKTAKKVASKKTTMDPAVKAASEASKKRKTTAATQKQKIKGKTTTNVTGQRSGKIVQVRGAKPKRVSSKLAYQTAAANVKREADNVVKKQGTKVGSWLKGGGPRTLARKLGTSVEKVKAAVTKSAKAAGVAVQVGAKSAQAVSAAATAAASRARPRNTGQRTGSGPRPTSRPGGVMPPDFDESMRRRGRRLMGGSPSGSAAPSSRYSPSGRSRSGPRPATGPAATGPARPLIHGQGWTQAFNDRRGGGGSTSGPGHTGPATTASAPRPSGSAPAPRPTSGSQTSGPGSQTSAPAPDDRRRRRRQGAGAGPRGTRERRTLANALRNMRGGGAGLGRLTAGRALAGLGGGPLGWALLAAMAAPTVYGLATGDRKRKSDELRRELMLARRMGGSPASDAMFAGRSAMRMKHLAEIAKNRERAAQRGNMNPELAALLAGEEARLAGIAQQRPLSFREAQALSGGMNAMAQQPGFNP